MTLAGLLTQQVDVVRYVAGGRDEWGNPTRTVASRVTYPARLAQASTTEQVAGQDTVVDVWRVYLPPDADIRAGDQVEEGGRVFQVDGTPDTKRAPAGPHHIETRLRYIGQVT